MLTQVFNIGVQIFFIISGFLVGYKGIDHKYRSWYIKRAKRIFVPYWIFVLVLASVYIYKGLNVCTLDWLYLFLGLQGSVVGVWGAGQTWFISVLLLCYLVSPIILIMVKKIHTVANSGITASSCMMVCVLPLMFAGFKAAWVYTIMTPVVLYTVACAIGFRYREHNRIACIGNGYLLPVMLIVISLGLRFAARIIIDGTPWYDRVIVPYTHMIAAFAIFVIFKKFFKMRSVPRVIQFVSDISFEIYLWHYMFTVGPVSLFGLTGNWLTDCVVTTVIVLAVSIVSKRLSTIIARTVFKPRGCEERGV
jgi:peptidoglycan/LPS O-acetylase OafA/YrhL